MPSDVMLSVAMKSIMLSVIMLNVVAPPGAVVGLKRQALGWWGKCSTNVPLPLATTKQLVHGG